MAAYLCDLQRGMQYREPSRARMLKTTNLLGHGYALKVAH